MDNIFMNLLNLYAKNKSGVKTPIEDFTTEILASLLAKDSDLLTHFMNEILLIEGNHFKVETQKKFILQDDTDCIIDVVISNQETLCFLENKVNSLEGYKQLERYKKVLHQFTKHKNIYLRYCTKYYDLKKISNINFHQIRWRDIYRFLLNYADNETITDFFNYLRRMNMAGADDFNFNFNDMQVMNQFLSTISKLDECLDAVTPEFTDILGAPYSYDFERLKQVPKFNRYAIWKEDIFNGGSKYDSKIILGFDFTTEEPQSYPIVFIGIVCNQKHRDFEDIKLAIENFNFDYIEADEEVWGWYEKPLSDFIPLENQFMEIKKRFIEHIFKLNSFKENTKHLNWN